MPKSISSAIMLNEVPFDYPSKIISKYLKLFIGERVHVLSAASDIEPLHRMRVASRRLRAALSVFKAVLPHEKAKFWKKEISRISRALGRARELDIHIVFLEGIKEKLTDPSCIINTEVIIKSLRKDRLRAQKRIEKILSRFNLKTSLPGLKTYLSRPFSGARSIPKSGLIYERLDKLLEFTPYVYKPKNIHKLHLMRIAAKNLRYTLEILKPWYGTKVNKYIRVSRDIQDVLGDLHELDVLIELLSGFLKGQGRYNNDATRYLLKKCLRLRKNYYEEFVRLWRYLEKMGLWIKLRREVR